MASSSRIAAQRRRCISSCLRLLACVTRRRCAGGGACARASPTVTTEPVTSTPPEPIASPKTPPASASAAAWSMASASDGGLADPVLSEDAARDLGELRGRHRAAGRVLGAHHVGQDRLELGEQPFDVLVRHHADHPDQRREGEAVLQRRDDAAAAPWGLCAASSTIVGERRMISSRPGRGDLGEGLEPPARASSGSSPPTKASTAASASAAFWAWWAPYSGRNTSS